MIEAWRHVSFCARGGRLWMGGGGGGPHVRATTAASREPGARSQEPRNQEPRDGGLGYNKSKTQPVHFDCSNLQYNRSRYIHTVCPQYLFCLLHHWCCWGGGAWTFAATSDRLNHWCYSYDAKASLDFFWRKCMVIVLHSLVYCILCWFEATGRGASHWGIAVSHWGITLRYHIEASHWSITLRYHIEV